MAKHEKEWYINNGEWYLRDINKNKSLTLKKSIYHIRKHPISGELFLEEGDEGFKFNYKVYALETAFISKVMKRYKDSTGNMGVLLNGVKGTGKTVTAEHIANQMELPIILVDVDYGVQLTDFLHSIEQDIVVFVDEYEKVFQGGLFSLRGDNESDDQGKANAPSTLLTLMDGTLKSDTRKVFLFTTNKLNINENMINRPSRLRYIKPFGDLNKEQIEEIVSDCLKNKKLKTACIEYIKDLEIITVDIVKAIVSEVNTFNEEPEICCKHFNANKRKESYSIVKLNPRAKKDYDKEKTIEWSIPAEVIKAFLKIAKKNWSQAYINYDNTYLRVAKAMDPTKPNHFVMWDANYGAQTKTFEVRLDKTKSYHSAYGTMNTYDF